MVQARRERTAPFSNVVMMNYFRMNGIFFAQFCFRNMHAKIVGKVYTKFENRSGNFLELLLNLLNISL